MNDLSEFSTYRTGILQARAYRNLRHFMTESLKEYGLTSTEWTMLGLISDETKNGGIRVSDVARMLDVEISFVTNTVKKLKGLKFVIKAQDEQDKRVRILIGTDKAHLTVIHIERSLRKKMKLWLKNINNDELVRYITVLQKISRNTTHT